MAQSEVLAAQLAEYGIKTAPKIDGRLNGHSVPVIPGVSEDNEELLAANDALAVYFAEVGRSRLLTFDEELSLGRQVQAGLAAQSLLDNPSNKWTVQQGKIARDRLITSNLRLSMSVARGYLGRGLPLGDLIQEGNLGLMKAAEKYDPDKGCRFSTYAYWWIRQGVTRAIAEQARTIRLPHHQIGLRNRISTVTAEFEQDFGRQPIVAETAEEMNLSPDKVRQVYADFQAIAPLSSPIWPDQEGTLDEIIADKSTSVIEEAEQRVFTAEVADVLEILPPRERAVIRYRCGMETGYPLTLQAVGAIMGVSRQRIQQLETAAQRKLRRNTRLREMAEVFGIPVNSPN